MLAAMDWLVREPNTTCFFHYSGHGGQVRDVDDGRPTGMDDTLVPVDHERQGQIDADMLHEHLVTNLARGSTLFAVLDCCHSGSALELPFVYRSDDNGNISVIDVFRDGAKLVSGAGALMRGGLSMKKVGQAKDLIADGTKFFQAFGGGGEGGARSRGLGGLLGGGDDDDGDGDGYLHHDTSFAEHEERTDEKKRVSMFSGCADHQTSADAKIGGRATGAMSWAFLKTIREDHTPTYEEVSEVCLLRRQCDGHRLTMNWSDVARDAQTTPPEQLPAGAAVVDGSQDELERAVDDLKPIRHDVSCVLTAECWYLLGSVWICLGPVSKLRYILGSIVSHLLCITQTARYRPSIHRFSKAGLPRPRGVCSSKEVLYSACSESRPIGRQRRCVQLLGRWSDATRRVFRSSISLSASGGVRASFALPSLRLGVPCLLRISPGLRICRRVSSSFGGGRCLMRRGGDESWSVA